MLEQPRCPSLESLPVELRILILQNLPDTQSLLASLLAHSSLYNAFQEDSTIAAKVLENQIIPPSLLPHALAVQQSASLKPQNRDQVQELFDNYYKTTSTQLFHSLPQVSLPDALHMTEVYKSVVFFTENFVSATLPLLSTTLLAPPSPTELYRIQRSLYRFELYCNLFRKYSHNKLKTLFRAKEQGEIFFKPYSPWENEQLACIHDYLLQQLSIAFDEVAAHDIVWGGEIFVDWLEGPYNDWKEPLLCPGLMYLYRLVTAKSYEERHHLLDSTFCSIKNDTLADGLLETNEEDIEKLGELANYDMTKTENLHQSTGYSNDHDSGPAEAWFWAHQDDACETFVFAEHHWPLRQKAYVMWDHARLVSLKILDEPWKSSHEWRYPEEQGSQHKAMMRSFDERSNIWLQGGRGWWSEGDTSKIIWH